MEPKLLATSPLYELTVSQVSDGEDDVRGKVVSEFDSSRQHLRCCDERHRHRALAKGRTI
jgi:hypothetical protein